MSRHTYPIPIVIGLLAIAALHCDIAAAHGGGGGGGGRGGGGGGGGACQSSSQSQSSYQANMAYQPNMGYSPTSYGSFGYPNSVAMGMQYERQMAQYMYMNELRQRLATMQRRAASRPARLARAQATREARATRLASMAREQGKYDNDKSNLD